MFQLNEKCRRLIDQLVLIFAIDQTSGCEINMILDFYATQVCYVTSDFLSFVRDTKEKKRVPNCHLNNYYQFIPHLNCFIPIILNLSTLQDQFYDKYEIEK